MLELYHHGTSVCASKVRFVLDEKKLDYLSQVVDLGRGEQLTPDYLKLNTKGVVPTLIDNGLVITESNVICEYIDDTFPSPPLIPKDAYARAQMRLWVRQLDEDIHRCTSILSTAIAFRHPRLSMPKETLQAYLNRIVDVAERERMTSILYEGTASRFLMGVITRFDDLLDRMQEQLQFCQWLAGDCFTLADIALAPYITRLDHLQLQFMIHHRPNVQDWFDKIKARRAYQTSHLAWFKDDAMVDLMRLKGLEERGTIKKLISQVQA